MKHTLKKHMLKGHWTHILISGQYVTAPLDSAAHPHIFPVLQYPVLQRWLQEAEYKIWLPGKAGRAV